MIQYAPNPFRPGKVSNYVRPISELPRGQECILICRKSSGRQERNVNLEDQEQNLRREVEWRGGVVVHVHAYVGSGWDPRVCPAVWEAMDRPGAVLVAEDITRLIRPTDYHSSRKPNAALKEWDLQNLRSLTCGLPLYTLADPDATPGEIRSRQTRRGQRAKGRRGGRPRKQEAGRRYGPHRRGEWLPHVLDRYGAGATTAEIVKELTKRTGFKIDPTTIRSWRRQHTKTAGN
jgi:hypothetical protein